MIAASLVPIGPPFKGGAYVALKIDVVKHCITQVMVYHEKMRYEA